MSEYLSIQHIQKQFDAFTALKDISFTVKKMSLFIRPKWLWENDIAPNFSGARRGNNR